MQLNIHDSTLKRIGFINNNLPNALHYFNDNWHRYLVEGTSTFGFSVNKVNPDYALLTLQNYISFSYDGDDYLFNIINIQQDHYSMQIQCENLNLKLISEEAGPYKNTTRHSIVWYLKNTARITDDIIEIGNNPFTLTDSDPSNPILSFDSSETKLARIISICTSFNAEFKFRTILKNDGALQNITIDLYKAGGVGQKRKDVTLFYGKNVIGITSTGDRTSTFFNSTTVTDSNGKYNWLSVEGKYYNSEGKLEFYKDAGSNTAYAPLSRTMFPSQIKASNSDQYTNKNIQTSASSADSLWDYAVSQFKLYAYPQMTYEVSVAVNAVTSALGNDKKLNIGDTIIVQDSTFDKSDGGLILSARVSEQEISFTNPLNNKITFTNFVRLTSDISADLYGRMKDLVDQNTPYRAELETTNGIQFKNGVGSTTLTARIYFGSDSTETVADSYSWTKDGTVVANAQTITVDASGVADKAVYSFKATIADKVVASQSVTITNVNDGATGAQGPQGPRGLKGDPGATGIPGQAGADGKTSYLHIAYATNSTGTAGFDVSNATGKTYIGQYTDFTSADSTDPSKYKWSLIKGDKGDKGDQGVQGIQGLQGPTGTQGVAGPKGADGKTQYTHIAYANSADGKIDFSTSDSNRTYIGMYVDFNINDSTTPSDYSWTLVKGADGTQGTPGKPGADGKTPYFHTAWSYSADGTNGFTTVYPNLNLLSGTAKFDNFKPNSSDNLVSTITKTKIPGITNTVMDVKTSGNAFAVGLYLPNAYNITAGQTITISFMARAFDNTNVWVGFENFVNGYKQFTVTTNWELYTHTFTAATSGTPNFMIYGWDMVAGKHLQVYNPKAEQGPVATPYMQSATEVTTADWPSYIGQYTDFTQADSTNPSDYTWSLIRGIDGKDGADGKDGIAGKDGVGIKTTVITYAISTSGTTAPTTGWTSSVPGLVKGQYLWTKTVWTYTDNSSETGYSVTYISKDGNNGNDGIAGKDGVGILTTTITYAGSTSGTTAPTSGWSTTVPSVAAGSYLWTKTVWAYTDNTSETGYSVAKMGNNGATGPAGSNGDPGKIVSDKEPTTKFVGLTWKYSGITAIDASDGTNIQPNTEYYWNGKNWVINLINAKNIITETLTALGDVTAGSFTLKEGDTGMSVKDGTVKSWGISKKPDPSVPGGYSNTSVGATLDSGNLTFYSADYNTISNDGKVIDPAKKAVLLSVNNHNTQSNAVTLVLESAKPNFQFLIVGKTVLQGDVTVYGGIRQTSNTASVTIGAGLTLSLERRGEMVIAILIGTINSSLTSGQQFTVGKIPSGFRPNKAVNIPAHMASSYNGAHIDAGTDGVCTWWGPSTNTGYPRGSQMWFTDDSLPN